MKLVAEEIKSKAAKYFSVRDEVKFAYLFGSQAKNSAGELSDIDIAVYLDKNLDEYKRFSIRLELISEAGSLAGPVREQSSLAAFFNGVKTNKIDLVILNDADIFLAYQVIFSGKVIYCRDELTRIRYEAKILSLYFDQQYYYERHAKLTIERIAKEGIL